MVPGQARTTSTAEAGTDVRLGEYSLAQRMGREKVRIDVERRGDFGKRPGAVARIDGGAGVGQPCLKSLPGFPGVHLQLSCKMSSRRDSRTELWTLWPTPR